MIWTCSTVDAERVRLVKYREQLDSQFEHQGAGEDDLYKLFLELGLRLAQPEGRLGMLVPAGLLRAAGSERLRSHLFDGWDTEIAVIENRSAFFSIDSRFKFLALTARKKVATDASIRLWHAVGTPHAVQHNGSSNIDLAALRRIRPDLTVPEVRSEAEWQLFSHLYERGARLDQQSAFSMDFNREVDMTNDRPKFAAQAGGRVPACR